MRGPSAGLWLSHSVLRDRYHAVFDALHPRGIRIALLGKIQKSLAPRLAGMRPGECELVLSGV